MLHVNEKKFTIEAWKKYPEKRYTMVQNLIDSKLLITKTQPQVEQLLGTPNLIQTTPKQQLIYNIGSPTFYFKEPELFLVIDFKNNKVKKVQTTK